MTLAVGLAEIAATAGPAALSMAVVVAGGRVRGGRRRRDLNRSLHELRRPLQALALGGSADHLASAMDALAELDRRVNGQAESFEPRPTAVREVAERAADRWREQARRHGGDVCVRWSAGHVNVRADPKRLAAALDNLLANAIEHGCGRVEVLAAVCPAGVRLTVANDRGQGRNHARRSPRTDPRRGHGLAVATAIARAHQGELRCGVVGNRYLATLELTALAPLAPGRLVAAS